MGHLQWASIPMMQGHRVRSFRLLSEAYINNHLAPLKYFFLNFRPVSCSLETVRSPPGLHTAASFASIQLPLQKLLFSATMTHSPEKLAPLQLYQPILFTVTGSVNQTKDSGESTAGTRCLMLHICYLNICEANFFKNNIYILIFFEKILSGCLATGQLSSILLSPEISIVDSSQKSVNF